MYPRTVLVLLTLSVVFYVNCDDHVPQTAGVSNTGFSYVDGGRFYFVPLPTNVTYALREYLDDLGGWMLGPYVALARNFILGLVKTDWDMIRGLVIDKEVPDLPETVKKFVPILVPLALGLVAGLLMWIIGIIFCMCRCCGNCGGKLTLEEARKQSRLKGFIMGAFAVVTSIMLLVGAGSIYQVGQRIPETGPHIVEVAGRALDGVVTFKDYLFDQIERVADEDLNFAVDSIIDEVDDMPEKVTLPFMSGMRPKVANIISAIDDIDAGVTGLTTRLDEVWAIRDDIHVISIDLHQTLDYIRGNLTQLKIDCPGEGIPAPTCNALPGPNIVPAVFDFTDTPSLTDQVSLLDDAGALDLTDISHTANETFEDIPERVGNSTVSIREDVKTAMRDATGDIGPIIDDARDSFGNMTTQIDGLKAQIDDVALLIEDNQSMVDLIPQAFMGIASIVFFILALAIFGLVFGLISCKSNPEERGKMGACSHCLFMTSVFFSFLFVPLFLVPGSIFFGIGAPLTMVCAPVRDLSLFDEVVDTKEMWGGKYLLSDILFNNGSIELTIGGILSDCRDNKAIYSTLKLQHLMNLENVIDLETMMPDLGGMEDSVSDTLSSVELLSDDTATDLDDIASSSANVIDTDSLMGDLMDGIGDLDLTTLISDLNSHAATLEGAGYTTFAANYRNMADDADYIQTTIKPILNGKLLSLTTKIDSLPILVDALLNSVKSVINDTLIFQSYLQANGGTLIIGGVENFMEGILGFAAQFISHVVNMLKNEIGRCSIVWDIYDGLTGTLCTFFLDSFNGLWLSLCIIGVFLIPYIIFIVKLTPYFRRPVLGDY